MFFKPLPDGEKAKRVNDQQDVIQQIKNLNDSLECPRVDITQWDDIPDVQREWLIPQWLPANTVTMFTGQGGAGKSWLTLQAVCQIACGFQNAFLNPDYQVPQLSDYDESFLFEPQHVVFATYEDEPAELKRRLQALASGMPWIAESLKKIQQHLHIVDMRGIGSVWGPGLGKHIANTGDLLQAGEDLRAICEQKRAKLLVMDPLSGVFGGNENDRTAVYDFVSSFRGWGDASKSAILVIGHLPKGAAGRAAGFSGSTAWEASARSMWKMEKKAKEKGKTDETAADTYWVLEHTKSNYAPRQPDIYLGKQPTGWWKAVADKEAAIEAYEKYQESITHTQEETYDATDIPNF